MTRPALAALMMTALALMLCAAAASAGQSGIDDELAALLMGEEEIPVYEFPKIEPEYSLGIGLWLTSKKGPSSIRRYEYLENSIALGAEARVFSFPHRAYLQYDQQNLKDYFLDLRYAYGDKVLFRWLNASLYHNAEQTPLVDLDPLTATPAMDERDAGREHGIASGHNNVAMRFKYPDYPAHLFLNYHSTIRDGSLSQHNLLGSGYFNDMKLTSQSREVDSIYYQYDFGGNAHLGPVEAQYAFMRRYFDTNSRRVMLDAYTGNASRAAGVYPHNSIPHLEGSGHTLKLHSSYTGKVAAAATVTAKELKNQTSGAKTDYIMGMASLTWMPVTSTTVFVTYRHKDMDIDNPSSVSITDAANSANTYTYAVKPSIASRSDSLSVTGRYRPVDSVTLRGRYRMERVERENAGLWGLPNDTTRSTLGLSLDGRAARRFTFKAEYDHMEVDDPAYNTEPDQSDRGRLVARWSSGKGAQAALAYGVTKSERGTLVYDSITNARDRESLNENSTATLTVPLSERATLTGSCFLIRNHVRQDLVYHDISGSPMVARGVLQRDKAQGFSLDLGYLHNERLSLGAGFSYIRSKGSFDTNNQDLSEPVSVGSFIDFRTSEVGLAASGDYKLGGGYSLQADYKYRRLNDFMDTPYDGIADGTVQTAMVVLARKW